MTITASRRAAPPPSRLQASLWDVAGTPELGSLEGADRPARLALDATSWVDVRRDWLRGADDVFDALVGAVPWRHESRQMYDSVVDVPRLTCFIDADEPVPHPIIGQARDRLSAHYRGELRGEPLATVGLCLYRDGRDSVAFHGDRIGRSRNEDTVIAILSVGAPRTLAMRRRDVGPTLHRWSLGHGDLVVMGGACQRTWDHGIPKSTHELGPRISIQFRVRGVR